MTVERYRVKLKAGRIIGPLEIRDFIELVYRGKLDGDEKIQSFPVGEWLPLASFPELLKIYESQIQEIDEETFIRDIKNLEITRKDLLESEDKFQEYDYKNKNEIKTVLLDPVKIGTTIQPMDEALEKVEDTPIGEEESLFNFDSDATRIRQQPTVQKKAPVNLEEDDQTKINPDYQKYLEQERRKQKAEEEKEKKRKELEQKKKDKTVFDYENEATQFMSVDEIVPELKSAIESEDDIRKERKKESQKKAQEQLPKIEVEEKKPDNKNRFLILAFAAILFILFVLPDEKDTGKRELKPIVTVEPEISFPVRIDPPDKALSEKHYAEGLALYRKFDYSSMVEAVKHFRLSVENNFDYDKAMHRLIFTSSYILEDSSTFVDDSNSIFKLILVNKSKILKDPFFASAVTLFYLKVGKTSAALSTVEKFKAIPGVKASAELLAVYLKALVSAGEFIEAKNIYTRIRALPSQSHFSLEAMLEYHKILGQTEEVVKVINEAKAKYPDSVYFDLEAGLLLADANKTEELKSLIYVLNQNNVEGSRIFHSKYLALLGLYHALKNNIDLAVKTFEKSLSLNRNLDIIEKLALLRESGNKKTDELITNSRALKELRLAENALRKDDIDQAFKHALVASNLAPNLLEVKLMLADIQLEKGYIEDAIIQLKKMYERNPTSVKLVFKLIDSYIEAYQFKNATNLMNIAASIPGGQLHDFYAVKAKLSLYRGDKSGAIGWYQRAANSNPIDDSNIYALAKLFLEAYRFLDAKAVLLKAMDLDPSKVEYKLLYGKILYEVESSSAAIGYLYNVLEDFPDHPAVLSEIGIYYYRSGEIKKYKEVKERLLGLPEKSPSLFRFLIESARLDDNVEKMIEYQKKLIEIDPGDLKTRMELASSLISLERYPQAKEQLEAVSERLKTYPRLNYLLARLYLLVDNYEKAKELAFREAKDNPTIDSTYVLLGEIYRREENLIESNKYFVKALQINPKNIEAMEGLADIALKNLQYQLALDQYLKIIDLDPNYVEAYRKVGDTYRQLSQSQPAIEYYEQYLQRKPNTKYKSKINSYIELMR